MPRSSETSIDVSSESCARSHVALHCNRAKALQLGCAIHISTMAREHIRILRKLKNMSQGALAKKAGLTVSEVSRIECGYRDLNPTEAGAIAKALEVAVQKTADEPRAPVLVIPTATAMQTPAIFSVVAKETRVTTGQDLNDPTNFRELPDLDQLSQGTLPAEAFRARLRRTVDRATNILHTSRVSADVWRAWRDFERRAQEALRSPTLVPIAPLREPSKTTDCGPAALLLNLPKLSAARMLEPFRIEGSSKERHEQKSYNALFVQAARKVLQGDIAAKLTNGAEHRWKSDRSAGFMRHFRNVACEMLPAAELSRIAEAIQSNESVRARRGRVQSTPPGPASTNVPEVAPPG